jgi:hypothetical protein
MSPGGPGLAAVELAIRIAPGGADSQFEGLLDLKITNILDQKIRNPYGACRFHPRAPF